MSDKAKKRRSGRDAKYYQNQFIVTERNKKRRAAQRERKAKSPAAKQRAIKRELKALANYEANLIKRRERAAKSKKQPVQPVESVNEEAQSQHTD